MNQDASQTPPQPPEHTEESETALNTPSKLAWLKSPAFVMLGSVFLFSVMVLCVKMASSYGYSNYEIIAGRGTVGTICLLVYLQVWHGHSLLAMKTRYFGMHMWRSFIGTLSMAFWFYGIALMPLANATTISYMSSIWMALFIVAAAMLTGKNRPDVKLLLSILVGFLGIVVMLRPSTDTHQLWASLIVLLSSVFTALAYLQVSALGRVGEPEYRTVFYFSLFGIVSGLLLTFTIQGKFSSFSWPGLFWIVMVGLTATIAQLCLTRAYTKGNVLVNSSLQYMGLVFVTLFDWTLGYGWPDALTWLGMGLVVSSGLCATLLKSRPRR